MKRAKLNPRKLLIASIGVATVDYIGLSGCAGRAADDPITVIANLMPPPHTQGIDGTASVANLMPPPRAGYITGPNAMPAPPSVANLVAPPPSVDPVDAGAAADAASDARDAGELDAG
jgi:hypothetical protein